MAAVPDGRSPAQLEADEPEWPMPQPHSPARFAPRRLRVWRRPGGTRYAVITERGAGMSITNAAPDAYAAIARRWPGEPLRVFEHYPAEAGADAAEHFDEITLSPGGGPLWRRVPVAALVDLLGPAVLDDMPPLPADPCDEHGSPGRELPAPAGPGVAGATVFHGYPAPGGALVVLEAPDGTPLEPLTHYVRHSPSGFSWGYHGSGAAELARCLLIAVLGAAARCPACDGRASQPGTGRCPDCDDGTGVPRPLYQAFKRAVVADWPAGSEWRITAGEIRGWLAAARPPLSGDR